MRLTVFPSVQLSVLTRLGRVPAFASLSSSVKSHINAFSDHRGCGMESAGAGSVSRSSSGPNIRLIGSYVIITIAWVYNNVHICGSHILLITNTPDRSLTWRIFQVRRSIFQVPPKGVAWVVPRSQEWLKVQTDSIPSSRRASPGLWVFL